MKVWKRKTRNYYSAPPFYQKLFDLGVPEKYWYCHPKELVFSQYTYDDEYDGEEYNLTREKQKIYAKKLLAAENPIGVVAIGSNPTCDLALATLFYFAKKYFQRGLKIKIHNMSSGINFFDLSEEDDADAIFIYNVNADDDPRRLQQVRDLIFETDGRIRFVAFAGDNPLKFFCEKIRYYPSAYFYLLGRYRKVLIEE